MKIRYDFVTNSSSSSFIISNNSDEYMDAEDVVMSLIASVLADAKDRFRIAPGESIMYECGDSCSDGMFERFIHNEFGGWTEFDGYYGDGKVDVKFNESHH